MMVGCIFAVLASLLVALGGEGEVLKNIEKLKEEGVAGEELLRRIERYREEARELKEKALERSKEWRVEKGGEKVVVEKKERVVKEGSFGKRIYIFMSSSVPREVWSGYMDYVMEKKLNAVFLLRGCVKGCRYIRSTLEFLRKVIGDRPVEVWIDPLKFKKYGVKAVPCVAVEGNNRLSCGDWNLRYHLEVLGNGKG